MNEANKEKVIFSGFYINFARYLWHYDEYNRSVGYQRIEKDDCYESQSFFEKSCTIKFYSWC